MTQHDFESHRCYLKFELKEKDIDSKEIEKFIKRFEEEASNPNINNEDYIIVFEKFKKELNELSK